MDKKFYINIFSFLKFLLATSLLFFFEVSALSSQNPSKDSNKNLESKESPSEETTSQHKALWKAHLMRRKDKELNILHLNFPNLILPVMLIGKDQNLRPLVQIRGNYNRTDWKLFAQETHQISIDSKTNEFEISVYLKGKVSEMLITARGPNGELEQERLYIYAPEAQEIQIISAWNQVILFFGVAGFNYYQTKFGSYRSFTGIFSAEYSNLIKKSRFGFITGADLTLLTINSQPSNYNPQLLIARFDGTFRWEKLQINNWQTFMIFGLNYLTMFTNDTPFGISNLITPEIGTRITYTLTSLDSIIGEFRFLPMGSDFSQYGMALKLAWNQMLQNAHRIEWDLDIIGYSYQPKSTVTVQTGFIGIKFGYSL